MKNTVYVHWNCNPSLVDKNWRKSGHSNDYIERSFCEISDENYMNVCELCYSLNFLNFELTSFKESVLAVVLFWNFISFLRDLSLLISNYIINSSWSARSMSRAFC